MPKPEVCANIAPSADDVELIRDAASVALSGLDRGKSFTPQQRVPAHGPIISEPQAKLEEYIAHRMEREQQVLQALEVLPPGATIPQMVQRIYTDVDPRLHRVAAWSVEAHLIKLEREGLVERLEEGGWTLVRPTA